MTGKAEHMYFFFCAYPYVIRILKNVIFLWTYIKNRFSGTWSRKTCVCLSCVVITPIYFVINLFASASVFLEISTSALKTLLGKDQVWSAKWLNSCWHCDVHSTTSFHKDADKGIKQTALFCSWIRIMKYVINGVMFCVLVHDYTCRWHVEGFWDPDTTLSNDFFFFFARVLSNPFVHF